MRISSNVLSDLLDTDDTRAHFLFTGDLIQMGTIYRALAAEGFPVVKNNVYPGFAAKDKDAYVRALKFLFDRRIDGWWNQESALVNEGVCTQDEYDTALGRPRRA